MSDVSLCVFEADADLTACNTLGLPARAARLATLRSVAALRGLIQSGRLRESGPVLVLGGGSNVVLSRDWPGWVLRVAIMGREWLGVVDGVHRVRAGAGERWHELVRWTLANGYPGLENLSLIPGTVGAAPIQNIGAYGVELAERFESLQAVSLDDGTLRTFSREAMCFGYRDSLLKQAGVGRWVIVSVTLRLPVAWQAVTGYGELANELAAHGAGRATPQAIADAVVGLRQRKLPDPARLGNVGSFFKNPMVTANTLAHLLRLHPDLPHYPQPGGSAKLAAGWLIERCGWKGRNLGPVGCYERQALVLVNRGGATGADVLRLAAAIQQDVWQRFGIQLEPEPHLI